MWTYPDVRQFPDSNGEHHALTCWTGNWKGESEVLNHWNGYSIPKFLENMMGTSAHGSSVTRQDFKD